MSKWEKHALNALKAFGGVYVWRATKGVGCTQGHTRGKGNMTKTKDSDKIKAWRKLPPHEQALAVAELLEKCAQRCEGVILRDSWVQTAFQGAAERLHELAKNLKK